MRRLNDAPVLSLDGVTFGYGAGPPVVDDVSLAVRPGEFVGLVGPNGSGKSTLMRLALGLLRPAAGQIRLFGCSVETFRERSRLSYMPQIAADRAGFPATVREVVLTGRAARRGLFRGYSGADRRAAERSLEQVGLDHLAKRPVGELSGGQRQRVFLARALAGEPELLFLDEPTSGVDEAAKSEILHLLRSLCDDTSLAVFYILHDFESVRPYLDAVALLNRRLLFFGAPADLDREIEALGPAAVAARRSEEHPAWPSFSGR